MAAAEVGELDLMIQLGNSKAEFNFDVFREAASSGKIEIFNYVESQLFPPTTSPSYIPPFLSYACAGGNVDIIRRVITTATELGSVQLCSTFSDIRKGEAHTALSFAIKHGVDDIFDRSIELGATLDLSGDVFSSSFLQP